MVPKLAPFFFFFQLFQKSRKNKKSVCFSILFKVLSYRNGSKIDPFLSVGRALFHIFSGIDLLRNFGRPLARLWLPLAPFGSLLSLFWLPSAPFRRHLLKLWLTLAPFQHPLGSILKLSVTLFNFSTLRFVLRDYVFFTICFFSRHVFSHPISKKTRTRPRAPPSKTSIRSHLDLPWTWSGNLPQAT
jgi:hypothetical protein